MARRTAAGLILHAGFAILLSMARAEPSPSGIASLLEQAKVGTEPPFRRFLESRKHAPSLSAPPALRRLLGAFEVLRLGAQRGLSYEDGRLRLEWWFDEIGVAGAATQAAAILEKTLLGAGFARRPAEAGDKSLYVLEKGPVPQAVRLRGPHRWVGGRRTACGFSMLWTASAAEPGPRPTVGEALSAWPELKDRRVPEAFYALIQDAPANRIALGGTWTRYYTWSASLRPPGDAAALRRKLEDWLSAQGYQPDGKGDAAHSTYVKNGAYVFLESEAEGLDVRLQPQSY